MKKRYLVYAFMALFCVALAKGAEFLIQKGFSNDDPMFWIYCFLIVGIMFGRLSVYIEYEGTNFVFDPIRKLKRKSQNKK